MEGYQRGRLVKGKEVEGRQKCEAQRDEERKVLNR